MNQIESIALNFIQTLQNRNSSEELIPFYHPEVEQIEYPNLLSKNKIFRNLTEILEGSEKGLKLLQKEEYEILRVYSFSNTVILEVLWKGILAIPIGNLQAGNQLKAYFAQFIEFKEGKIFRQRNYDCFESFLI